MLEGSILSEIIQNYGAITALIGGITSGLYITFKRVILPMFRGFQKLNKMHDQVQVIFDEVNTNNGSSIKDQISAIGAELIEISEMQKAVILDTEEAHFKSDSKGNLIWINRTFARVTGRTPTELMGHGWHNALLDKDRDRVIDAWQEAVNEKRELSLKFKFETPDGIIVSARLRSYKMTNLKGELVGYFGTIVTDKSANHN